jgi:hypothetical protein
MTSHGSKVGIGPPIRLGMPLHEGGERITDRFSGRTRQDDAPLFDAVGNFIPLAQTESRAHRLRDGSLCLSGEFACDYQTSGSKEIPYDKDKQISAM